MRLAVVGHVEWVWFAVVERVPLAGEIAHVQESWEEPAGGGGVAAVQLARMGAEVDFFTALGDDERGREAEGAGSRRAGSGSTRRRVRRPSAAPSRS